MERKDILLDNDFDLLIENGDFVIDNSDNQHAAIIFKAQKGEIRSAPEIGFGAARYLKKTGAAKRVFLRNLKVELEKDGYKSVDVSFDVQSGKLQIELE